MTKDLAKAFKVPLFMVSGEETAACNSSVYKSLKTDHESLDFFEILKIIFQTLKPDNLQKHI